MVGCCHRHSQYRHRLVVIIVVVVIVIVIVIVDLWPAYTLAKRGVVSYPLFATSSAVTTQTTTGSLIGESPPEDMATSSLKLGWTILPKLTISSQRGDQEERSILVNFLGVENGGCRKPDGVRRLLRAVKRTSYFNLLSLKRGRHVFKTGLQMALFLGFGVKSF